MQLPDTPPTLRERAAIHEACRHDARLRERVRQRCAENPAWFINFACWTFDPRPDAPAPHLPFILYPFQEELIEWLNDRVARQEDGLIDKSRDMGVTWTILAWILHGWLFRPGFVALIGSAKEQLVDNRTVSSLFGRIDYMLDRLPGWLLPVGFNPKRHRQKLKLVNPENGNVIEGDSATGDFGRQRRATVIFCDEAAFWPNFSETWAAISESTRTRIACSTPFFMNAFGQMVHSGKYPHLRLHWTLHPKKDQAWYERQKQRMSAEDLAREVDISYSGSDEGKVYPTWANVPKGIYPRNPEWPLYVSWDFGLDETAIIWWQRDPVTGDVQMIDCYSNRNKPIDFYVPFVTGAMPPESKYQYTEREKAKIALHATWGLPIHFGDPSVVQRSAAQGISVADVLRQFGIHVVTNFKARDFRTRKVATELGLRNLAVHIDPEGIADCTPVDEAMTLAHYPRRNQDAQFVSDVTLPVHDGTSHYRSAVEYFFVNLPPLAGQRARRRQPVLRKMIYDELY